MLGELLRVEQLGHEPAQVGHRTWLHNAHLLHIGDPSGPEFHDGHRLVLSRLAERVAQR